MKIKLMTNSRMSEHPAAPNLIKATLFFTNETRWSYHLFYLEEYIFEVMDTDSNIYRYTYKFDIKDYPNTEFETAIMGWLRNTTELSWEKRHIIELYISNKRWPLLEKVLIARGNAIDCANYVFYVIRGKWPEAEPIMRRLDGVWDKYIRMLELYEN